MYVSRHRGNDSQNCGSEKEPCRTLSRGIEIADRNGFIWLDGTLTKLSPYNCRRNKTWKKSKTCLLQDDDYVLLNFGIQITALYAPAYISCNSFLNFFGLSSRSDQVNVNFSGIVFINTSMTFLDLSVSFVNCSFLKCINPVKTALLLQQSATVVVERSVFFNNTGCIRVKLAKSDTNTRVAIYLNKVSFKQSRPFLEHEGSGISIYKPLQAQVKNVNVFVSCKKTVFSDNIGPLITNNATSSESNEFYQDVKFLKNYVSDGQNTTSTKRLYFSMARSSVIVFDNLVSTGNTNVRCVEFKSNVVKLKILNSHFSGHQSPGSGGSVLVNATNSIDALIKESSFNDNKAGDNGGAVAVNSVGGLTEITILRSNFTKNSAAQDGGAFFINSLHGSVAVAVQYVLFQRTSSGAGTLSITANREIYFRARHSIWESSAALYGSAVSISTLGRQESKTTTIVENCKFINNLDAHLGNFLVSSIVGTIEVSQTEWTGNGQGFFMECDCVVNFTDVNLTKCNETAFIGFSSQVNKAIINLYFERCSFRANKGNDIDVFSQKSYFQLTIKSTNFYEKKITRGQGYNALRVVVDENDSLGSQILLSRVHIEDFVGAASVTLKFENNGANTVIVRNCTFRRIRSYYSQSYHTEVSPLSIIMPFDNLNRNVCSQSYLSYQYRNTLIIENTSFVGNIGRMSGGVYFHYGNVTIRNCTFDNNFAIQSGGHIHIADGSAAVQIEDSHFKQSSVEKAFANETYVHDTSIYSDSTGSLVLRKTLVTTDLEKNSYRLFSVTKAGKVKFDNDTRVQCAVGSALRFDNFSHLIIWHLEPLKPPCKLKVSVITLSCHQCSPSLYSLKRGEVTALHDREDSVFPPLTCISCPNGANCSRNIFAKPNYWGYPDSNDHGSLKFAHCPPHYCTPTGQRIESLSVYNRCYGNRDGIMCGKCKDGYSEALFSKKCKQNEKCKDHWIWILIFIYVVVMALFLIHQPPILEILMRSTLWFKTTYPHRMEYQPLDQRNNYGSGYTKIIFYFYQIASYLTLESLAEVARKAPYVSFFIGLFNFQTRISLKRLGCPFSGLTVVTKELTSALVVMATLFTIQVILMLHLSLNKFTNRPPPMKVRYYGAILRTLLLGYATLANTSLKLLSCVPVLGESRLFYDGNIKCLTWWQDVLAIFIVSFLLPFIVVICWGGMKLRKKLISVEHFIGACFFPSFFIAYWLVQKLFRRWHRGPVASESRHSILQILHDPFRPPSPGQNGSLYWESVLIGRRFLLLSYQVFFPDPLLRLFCMDMTCLLIFVWHVATKPFRDWKANVMEAMSLAALVVIATINLVEAIFLSAGVTPQGPVKRNLNILRQIEIFLLGIIPLLLALLCALAIVSQVVRLIVLIYKLLVYAIRKIFRFVLIRRIRVMGQQYVSIN